MRQIYVVILCIACILYMSCTEKEVDSETNVFFNVSVTEVNDYSATITITHSGTNRDCYYGFVVKDTVTDIYESINDFLASSDKEKVLTSLKSQRKKVIPIRGLSPKKTYTYIAFGIDEEGQLYGTPAHAEFTTTAGELVAIENPNWEILYQGPDLFNNGYYSKYYIKVIGDPTEHYFVYDCTADFLESFTSEEELIIHAIEEFKEQYLGEDEVLNEDFWINESFVMQGSYFYYHVLDEGEYVAYAIGVNLDGTPTGYYVKTPVFQVEEYPAVENYNELLTNPWQITDLYTDSVNYNVTFEKLKVNQSLLMYGWGNLPYPLVVNFNQNQSEIIIYPQLVATNVLFNIEGIDVTGDLYLKGWYLSNSSPEIELTTQSYALTTGKEYSLWYGFIASYYANLMPINGITYVLQTSDGTEIILPNTKMDIPFCLEKNE